MHANEKVAFYLPWVTQTRVKREKRSDDALLAFKYLPFLTHQVQKAGREQERKEQ